jgi:hypothetical protein
MTQIYKEKILKDINDIPLHKLPRFYKIVHLLKNELVSNNNKAGNRQSLRGIWKGSNIDDDLIDESKKSLFCYE